METDAKANDKKKRNPAKSKSETKPKLLLNVEECVYKVIKSVLKNQFHMKATKTDFWHLKWTDKAIDTMTLRNMKPFQRINHFPGMYNIARKDNLAFHLNSMKTHFKSEYNFFPKTFVLPCHLSQLETFMTMNSKEWMIAKPQASAEGKGVSLLKKFGDVLRLNDHIVQRYISKPLLLDGYKFDLRIYVLVLSLEPLKICMYNDGLVRLATKLYEKPNHKNKKFLFQHLTNYAINKRNPDFKIANTKSEIPVDNNEFKGFKRSLKEFFRVSKF